MPTLAEQKKIVFEFQREENKIEELKQEIAKHNQNIDVKIEGLCGD